MIDVDGSHSRLLARHASAPAWSPDGTKIAYRALDGIRLMTPAGRPLSPRPPFRPGVSIGVPGPPVWSPDGEKIAVAKPHRGTFVMNADGSELTRLTTVTGSFEGARFSQQRLSWRPVVSVLLDGASPLERLAGPA